MKELPSDPFAFQARIMSALIGDIRDLNTATFPRLNALRHISSQGSANETSRESVHANNVPDSNQ